MDGKDFVLRIDSVLKEKKLKRLAVAEAVSISTQAFSHWSVRGSMPAADTALKIAEFLGVSVEWLITGKDKENLTDEERVLLDRWRSLDDSQKEIIMPMIETAAESSYKKKKGDVSSY